jgi:hypothetical protein
MNEIREFWIAGSIVVGLIIGLGLVLVGGLGLVAVALRAIGIVG